MAFLPTDRLALLNRVSQTFNSTLELDEVLERVMDEVIAVMHAERGFLMLRNAAGRLEFQVARGMDQHTLAEPEFQISRGVVDRVAAEGQPRLTSDAQSDAWLGARASVAGLGLRSILCVPLQLKGATTGVIYVDSRSHAGIFTADDLDLLSTLAVTAATAIENARLYQVAVEKGRLEQELAVARTVQASLIPAETPRLPSWEFAAWWKPAHIVSGDYYDFISFDFLPPAAPGPADRQGLVIADVSDKGIGAALFMAAARSIVRASVLAAASPAGGIAQANRLICADAANGMFVTLCYVLLDGAGDLAYVNAGHNPPLVYHAREAGFAELERTGIVLGIDKGHEYGQRSAHLDANDFLVLYTDGITDAIGMTDGTTDATSMTDGTTDAIRMTGDITDASGETNGITDAADVQEPAFGLDRLQQVLYENREGSAQQIVAAIERALGVFVGTGPQFDDMTVVVAKRL